MDLKSIEMTFIAHSLMYLTFDIDPKQYADFQPERAPVNPQLEGRGVSSVCIAITSVSNGSNRAIPVMPLDGELTVRLATAHKISTLLSAGGNDGSQ